MFERDLESSGMPEGDFEWFRIEATIELQPGPEGIVPVWEPSMIHLTKNDGQPRAALEWDVDCLIAQVERWDSDAFVVMDHGSIQSCAGASGATYRCDPGYDRRAIQLSR